MSIANDQAFPSDDKIFASGLSKQAHSGLTKREYFAALAMQGLISCHANWDHKQMATIAVQKADALIAELEKETK